MRDATWSDIAALVRQNIEPGHYKVWIAPLSGKLEGDALLLQAVSAFAASFVRERFGAILASAATEVVGREIRVRISDQPVPGGVRATFMAEEQAVKTSVQLLPELSVEGGQCALPLRYAEPEAGVSGRNWHYSFEDFVVGPCNELAFAASRNLCQGLGVGTDMLFLCSEPGLGKTHLVQATGARLCQGCNHVVPRVEYLTAEEFASRLVASFRTRDTDRFKAKYRDLDVLLLEDVHFLQGKEKIQEELLATIKALQDRGGRVVFSSSFIPRDLRGFSAELLSRLQSGLLAVMGRPDIALRKKIFDCKAKVLQVDLPDDVSTFLARNINRDVRQIESCLRSLALKARLLKSAITLELAQEAVRYYAPVGSALNLEGIIRYVAQGYGVEAEQMGSRSRRKALVLARNTVFFLARKHTELSLEQIGAKFGRSHSAVIKGITSLEREMGRETALGRQIAGAIARIEQSSCPASVRP